MVIQNPRLFLALLLLFSSAALASEEAILNSGKKVIAYRSFDHDLPEEQRIASCEKQAFWAGIDFSPLPDGKYTTAEEVSFLMEKGCLLTYHGKAKLTTGEEVEFYQDKTFNDDGVVVVTPENGLSYRRLSDGKYTLIDGQEFETEAGHIIPYGDFIDGKIIYEDRD